MISPSEKKHFNVFEFNWIVFFEMKKVNCLNLFNFSSKNPNKIRYTAQYGT